MRLDHGDGNINNRVKAEPRGHLQFAVAPANATELAAAGEHQKKQNSQDGHSVLQLPIEQKLPSTRRA